MAMEKQNPEADRAKMRFLGAIGIIKSAIVIPFRDRQFISSTFFASLPLFSAMVFDELLVQHKRQTVEEISSQMKVLPEQAIRMLIAKLSSDEFIRAKEVLHVIFWDLLSFILTLTTIYSASVIYAGGRLRSSKEMLQNAITKSRWKNPLVAVFYTAALNYILQTVLSFWTMAAPLFVSINLLSWLVWSIIVLTIFKKAQEYTAKWNMGVVISILEEKGGFEAMSRSANLMKGNELRGSVLMVLHFAWRRAVVSLTRNIQGNFSVRLGYALLQTSFLCLGKVMKCLVCLIYYYDCRRRHGESVDAEVKAYDLIK